MTDGLEKRIIHDEIVFDVKAWPLLGTDYWMAQAYREGDHGTVLTSISVDPTRWNARLIDGYPIRHRKMIAYFPIGVCKELQRRYDEWRGTR